MHLADLPTPCLVLDRARLERNAARMRAIAAQHGVRLRPHLKTSKSIDVARVLFGDTTFRGATVSTLEEAAYFVEHGLRDLVYAVGITPQKLDRVAALQARGPTVGLLTDDVGVARAIGERAEALDTRFEVWIEIDSGQHRGGLACDDDALIELARVLATSSRVTLAGVLTHAGHSYGARSADELTAIAEDERARAVRAAERLREAGFACPEVSVGSTPTATHARRLEGATELRAGVYTFGDLFQASIGTCVSEDLALSVLASVVARRDDALWIDAGALALSQDHCLDGYGEARDEGLRPLGARVDRVNQVHGRIVGSLPPLEVGARVRILPNHACHTAAMFDRYYVVDEDRVVAEWPRLRG
jgi:D-serine deaminase-like pyridoxal phosphate-dependent protein